ncbi:hypothetical protein GCM10027020_04240 [Nocardioides salsibiostraticola]
MVTNSVVPIVNPPTARAKIATPTWGVLIVPGSAEVEVVTGTIVQPRTPGLLFHAALDGDSPQGMVASMRNDHDAGDYLLGLGQLETTEASPARDSSSCSAETSGKLTFSRIAGSVTLDQS